MNFGPLGLGGYPASLFPEDRVAPVPRRIRAFVQGEVVVDTQRAVYVWEGTNYPQYYVPVAAVRPGLLVPEEQRHQGRFGMYQQHSVQLGDRILARAARVVVHSPLDALVGTVRFEWSAFDAWFEEDEQVFVHPRNPYVRVDALRSSRSVVVELEGVVLARTNAPVLVFETGLPTRYYIDRTHVDLGRLVASNTVTACPYKGTTSGYWSFRSPNAVHDDIAWTYDFPTRQLLPIAGMIAFYNERVDLTVEGFRLERPTTPFSRS